MRSGNMQIVTIDGPSGAGKSTVARRVAEALSYRHLDTGAMYRAVALAARRSGISPDDGDALDSLCEKLVIGFSEVQGEQRVFLDGEDVSVQIRTPEMSAGSSAVSSLPQVRDHMVRLQREIGREGGLVAEGRDMGTVVFPESKAKFYLDASLEERARRRFRELKERGVRQQYEEVREEMEQRDQNDSGRDHSPLKMAEDAQFLDTTDMTPDEVVDFIVKRVRNLEDPDG